MVFKRLFFFLFLFCLSVVLPSAHGQNAGRDDANVDGQGASGGDRSEKSDAELYNADKDLRNKLAMDPGNAAYYFELSNIDAKLFDRTQKDRQLGEWLVRSGEALEKVVMLDPTNKVAYFNLGVVYKREGRMERAREQLKKGISLCRPGQDGSILADFWIQIGETYETQKFYDEAKEAYLKARDFDYGNQEAQEALSDLRAKLKSSEGGKSSSPFSMAPSLGGGRTGAAMSGDPVAEGDGQNQGIMQALPALGQMAAQKFAGGGSGDQENGQR